MPSEQKGAQKRGSVSKIVDRFESLPKSTTERTFIALKPDGVHRGLVGKVISRFEDRGFKLIAMKMVHVSKKHLETHYEDLKNKPFFSSLIDYCHSGPMIAGLDAIKQCRIMLGETDPLQSPIGTIRGDFCLQPGRNLVHGSDSAEAAEKEIKLWFHRNELMHYDMASRDLIYE